MKYRQEWKEGIKKFFENKDEDEVEGEGVDVDVE